MGRAQVPTPEQIRAQVASVLSKAPDARVIGIQVPRTVTTGATLQVNGAELPIALCDTVLRSARSWWKRSKAGFHWCF
jgi:hypothetical protein